MAAGGGGGLGFMEMQQMLSSNLLLSQETFTIWQNTYFFFSVWIQSSLRSQTSHQLHSSQFKSQKYEVGMNKIIKH